MTHLCLFARNCSFWILSPYRHTASLHLHSHESIILLIGPDIKLYQWRTENIFGNENNVRVTINGMIRTFSRWNCTNRAFVAPRRKNGARIPIRTWRLEIGLCWWLTFFMTYYTLWDTLKRESDIFSRVNLCSWRRDVWNKFESIEEIGSRCIKWAKRRIDRQNRDRLILLIAKRVRVPGDDRAFDESRQEMETRGFDVELQACGDGSSKC